MEVVRGGGEVEVVRWGVVRWRGGGSLNSCP